MGKIAEIKGEPTPALDAAQIDLEDDFISAYIEAMLFFEGPHEEDEDGNTDDSSFSDLGYESDEIAPVFLDQIITDCRKFLAHSGHLLTPDNYVSDRQSTVPAMAGQDFWLTRNGHGAGFWDGDWKEAVGEQLTEATKNFNQIDLYVGDDELIYGG